MHPIRCRTPTLPPPPPLDPLPCNPTPHTSIYDIVKVKFYLIPPIVIIYIKYMNGNTLPVLRFPQQRPA